MTDCEVNMGAAGLRVSGAMQGGGSEKKKNRKKNRTAHSGKTERPTYVNPGGAGTPAVHKQGPILTT